MGKGKQQQKCITDVDISTCPASKSNCRDDRMDGNFVPCYLLAYMWT